ncbi:MAG: DUF456 domain-containing protein [Bacteroidales bacterium]|nr:DUF456 domain-containing protein [Bacteroidales bacterium]
MDSILIIIGIVALIAGIIGCIAPVIPGPPIAYISLILLQCSEKHPFSTGFMIGMGLLTLAVTILDYLIPAWGTQKFGGSKFGSWGCLIGTFLGFFILPPLGIILMPFLGAFVGEILYNRSPGRALKAATGSLLGFLGGVFCKVLVCIAITAAFIWGVW